MTDLFDRVSSGLGDRYAVQRELGSVGIITAFLAEDREKNRAVVLKVVRPDVAEQIDRGRFAEAMQRAAELQHPNIQPQSGAREVGDLLFYATRVHDGHTLRERLTEDPSLRVTHAVFILRDVVDALAHAHEEEIFHLALRPEAVFLAGRYSQLIDLGVTHAVLMAAGDPAPNALEMAGSPAYLAPEQVTADAPADDRTDIYQFGILSFELLTGNPLFAADDDRLAPAHAANTAEREFRIRATIPPALMQMVMRCLERRPDRRWQSASELLPQLEALGSLGRVSVGMRRIESPPAEGEGGI